MMSGEPSTDTLVDIVIKHTKPCNAGVGNVFHESFDILSLALIL
jgi:hypothetical protein